MIAGYGMHGLGDKALQTFNRMIESGFEPDGVTFVACLSSCSHAGLVSKGREIFDQMDGERGTRHCFAYVQPPLCNDWELHVSVKYIRCKRKMGRFCEGENLSKDKGFEENCWLKLDLGEEESVDVFIWGSCGDRDE
ncbi:hypothetical protein POM88_012968 [Heracleum sosnowskyi]|uniref:Pentatricopeptide repeat-containing protein n=1 Tax=Heracleum sosnowskyi TaxID=360622 RepID=A0AAD8J0X5_9APIA|nr:hypothetical protein POM88_012968 [Heracleum sosnowskyi]